MIDDEEFGSEESSSRRKEEKGGSVVGYGTARHGTMMAIKGKGGWMDGWIIAGLAMQVVRVCRYS